MKCIKAPFLILTIFLFLFGFDNTAQSAVVVAPGSIAICQNTNIIFNVVNPQPANSIYTWQDSTATGWVNLINNTYLVAVNDTLFITNVPYSYNNSKFRCIVDSAGAGLKKDTSAYVEFNVLPVLPKGLLNNNQLICYNTAPDTVRAINYPANGLGWYTYQWQSSIDSITWQNISGQTSIKLKLNKLIQSTFVRLVATTISGCKNDTAKAIIITVLGYVSKPVITASQNICFNTAADTLRVQSIPSGGGNVFSFQWQISSNGTVWSDILGKTDLTLAPGILTTSTYFRYKATSANGCATLFSDSVKVTVYGAFSPGLITGNQAICFNTIPNAIQFFTLPNGAGNLYTYQWQASSDSINFSDIVNPNVFSFQPANLLQTVFYRVNIISNSGCGSAYTNSIKIKVYPLFVGASINKSQTICYNSAPDTIRLLTNPSGGSGGYFYQWQSSTDSINWFSVNGQNSATLKLPKLLQTTYIRLFNQCAVGCGLQISNAIKIKVLSGIFTKPRITQAQSICYNASPDTLRLQVYATGADNKFIYQWQSSTSGTNWIDISGATTLKFTPGNLTQTTYYRINAIGTFGCRSISSDSVKINVYNQLSAGQLSNNQTICYNATPASMQFALAPSGGGDVYSYQWQVSSDSINFTNINGALFDNYQSGKLLQTRFYRVKITSINGCGEITSGVLKIKVNPIFKGAVINADQNVCYNLNPNSLTIRTPASGGDGNYFYQWQIGLNSVWSTIPTATNPIHNPAKVQKDTYFRLINYSGSGCGRDTSNVIRMTVLPLPDTTTILGVTTVCRNQQEVRYGIAQTNANYTYFWSTSGGKIVSNPTDKVAYVNWGLKDGVDTLRLTQINKVTGCLNEMKLPVRIKFGQAPTKSKILRKENSDLLFCSDSTFGIVYQWGFLTKSTNLETDIAGGNLRYVLLPHTFDTTLYEYYLKTSLGACETKSYYNKSSATGITDMLNTPFSLYPNPSNGIVNIKSNNIAISSIKVFDNQLRLIDNIILDNTLAAQFKLNAPPGIYFVQIIDNHSLHYWAKLILGGQ
jgi:hypothetical protein